MRTYDVVIEQDSDTGLFVGYVPGWPGAHTQGANIEEVQENLREVLEMLLADGEPTLESQLIGVRKVQVA
jgi:predicted RNase H-like HicB family nuclease